jgi:hypothetical protein
VLNAHTLRFLELAANKQDCLQRSKQNLHNYYRQWIIHLWLFSDRHAIAHKSDLPMGTTLQTWTAFSADPLHVAQNRIRGQSLYTLHPPEHCVPTCLRAYVPTCLRAYVLQSTVCLCAYVPTCLRAPEHCAYVPTNLELSPCGPAQRATELFAQ